MTLPFEKKFTYHVDNSDKTVTSAWFGREVKSWEIDLQSRVLMGGKSGGSLKRKVLEIITKSKEVIALCSFILGDKEIIDALMDAAGRDVRVYILTASEQRLRQSMSNDPDDLQERMRKEHESMLDLLAGTVLLRDAETHAKFIISDSKTDNRMGVLSTANFTTEAFEHPELGVVLNNAEISHLYKIFVSAWWTLAEHELLGKKRLNNIRPIVPPIDDDVDRLISQIGSFRITFPHRKTSLREEIIRLIRESATTIYISTYGISDDDDEVYTQLEDALASGKSVNLLIRPRAKTTPIVERLVRKGAEVRGLDWLHAKVVVSDTVKGVNALIMTANLEKISLQDGYEVGFILPKRHAVTLLKIIKHWWDNANWDYALSRRYRDCVGKYMIFHNGQPEQRTIKKKRVVDLGEIALADLADYYSFRPNFPETNDAIAVTYQWKITPPILPSICKPITDSKYPHLSLWERKKGKLYIAIKSEKELKEVLSVDRPPNAKIVLHTE
ncbi:MAG: phospholipase D-like domain-containing protein [Candidatus Thorarchaeota archaeon]|nr:phospholipase D-like domain-containing protein [Candidatus Thorarchaeota archaeon]